MSIATDQVAIAFAFVIVSALATGVGASVVFFPKLVKLADRRVLAASLGFAAGIMGYVSFVEIFPKSQLSFELSGYSSNKSFNLASLCFFGGIATMHFLNLIVHKMICNDHHQPLSDKVKSTIKQENCDEREEQAPHSSDAADKCTNERKAITTILSYEDINSDWGLMCLPGCSDDLEFYNYVISNIDKEAVVDNERHHHAPSDVESPTEQEAQNDSDLGVSKLNTETVQSSDVPSSDKYNDRKLLQMGLVTAVAIALHNFPEGLATFVAVLDNPSAGAVLAIAIAIHNVPEGLCVAIPVYYATGNRRKAFMWGALSGMSELIAAFIGWAVLSSSYSETLFGVLFGLVSGMMVSICIRELLPTAHRHDPHDELATKSFVFGMLVMGFSLVLFRI